MRILEVRRHTMRRKPNMHISPEGRSLAELVSENQPSFDLVVSSDFERSIQTAEAMGYKVDQIDAELGHLPQGILDYVGWPKPFSSIAESLKDISTQAYAQNQVNIWQNIIQQVPENGRALIIGHGVMIELSMAVSIPNANHAEWGGAIGYCEGISLTYQDDKFTDYKILRVPKEHHNASD